MVPPRMMQGQEGVEAEVAGIVVLPVLLLVEVVGVAALFTPPVVQG